MDENESETAGAAREGRDSEPLDARESKAESTIQQHRIYLYLRGLAQGGGSGESGQCAFGCMMKECEVAIVVLRVRIFFERVCAVRASPRYFPYATVARMSAAAHVAVRIGIRASRTFAAILRGAARAIHSSHRLR